MMQGADPATLELRDIHLPDALLWWPPAPGWWMLLILIIITGLSVFLLIRQRRNKRLSASYMAKQELIRIESEYQINKDKSILIKELSKLIRRLSISLFNRSESASLTGQNWLMFLDQSIGNDSFSKGIGRVLIEAPYQEKPDYNETELLILIRSWIDSADQKKPIKKEMQK